MFEAFGGINPKCVAPHLWTRELEICRVLPLSKRELYRVLGNG